MGDAKSTNKPRDMRDLRRLEHLRDLLGDRAKDAQLALFSRNGFARELDTAIKDGSFIAVSLMDMLEA